MNVRWIGGLLIILSAAACSPKYPATSGGTDSGEAGTDVSGTPEVEELVLPEVEYYPDLKAEGDGPPLSDRELANKVCFCAFDLNRMNEDIQRYHRNNDRASLVRTKGKVQQAYAKFDRCMAELKAEYPKAIAESDPEEVMREIEKECPTLAQLLEAGSLNIRKEQ